MERFLFLSCKQLGTAGSTRQMPYGLRWETLIEGLKESNSHQNKKSNNKKGPQSHPLSSVVSDTDKEREQCPGSFTVFPSARTSSAVSLRPFILSAGKIFPLPPQLWKAKKKKKKNRNSCIVFIWRKKLPTQRTWALLKVA